MKGIIENGEWRIENDAELALVYSVLGFTQTDVNPSFHPLFLISALHFSNKLQRKQRKQRKQREQRFGDLVIPNPRESRDLGTW